MLALVTGAAGFIGSTLSDQLLVEGWHVRGVDCFTAAYSLERKQANLASASRSPRFEFVEADLRLTDVAELLEGVEVVFHEAAQPGVRTSFDDLDGLLSHNLLATGRLLEAAKIRRPSRLVFASSSSVYGNAAQYPTDEDDPLRPLNPYAVSKAAAEQLCRVFADNFALHTVALRYFTVYGPRQRPDMAIHRLFEALLDDRPFLMHGDGSASREFTYVNDVVRATIAAATAAVPPGTAVNIAGGTEHRLNDVLAMAGELAGRSAKVDHGPGQPGDVVRSNGRVSLATEYLGWAPEVSLRDGLAAQLAWHHLCRT